MVKVSVFYPNEEGKRFDWDYYLASHCPLLKNLLGTALKKLEIDKGIAGATPGTKAAFVAAAHLHFDSVEDFAASFTPHAAAIMGDIPNYTDINPVAQINEVKM